MLDFDIDADSLQRVAKELGATTKEIQVSYNRALKRTAATLRKKASQGLQSELGLRRAAGIRRRLKTIRIKGSQGAGVEKLAAVKLWYGLNDMPVSEFKGRVVEGDTGAGFTGEAGSHQFPGAFVARSRSAKRRTILRRIGASRLPIRQERLPIKDKADIYVEDEIFDKLEAVFWHHFRDDLERRIAYLRAS